MVNFISDWVFLMERGGGDGMRMTRIWLIGADFFLDFFICGHLLDLRYLRAIPWNADDAD
jgi:hypothetical protein